MRVISSFRTPWLVQGMLFRSCVYMSGLLAVLPWKWNELADDLESFVHILCIMCLRFHRHTYTTAGPITPTVNAAHGQLLSLISSTYFEKHDDPTGMTGTRTKHLDFKTGYSDWRIIDKTCGLAQSLEKLYSLCQSFHQPIDLRDLRGASSESVKLMHDREFRFSPSTVFDTHAQSLQALRTVLHDSSVNWPPPSEKTEDQFDGLQMVDGCQAVAKDTTYASVSVPPVVAVNAPSISSKRGRSPDSGHSSAKLPADSEPRKKAKQPQQTGCQRHTALRRPRHTRLQRRGT